MGSLAIGYWTAFVFTDNYIGLLLYTFLGLLGGWALGSLNSRKARTQVKYKNEYTTYAGMSFAGILALTGYYMFMAIDKISAKVASDLGANNVILIAMAGGLMCLFGLGLAVANALAE